MMYEWVRVEAHIVADPKHVVRLLQEVMNEYKLNSEASIIKRIAKLQHIHPFVDGIGTIRRVLNNYMLIPDYHVPINMKFIDRSQYYDAINAFDLKGDTKIMEEIVGRALSNSYNKRLAYMEGKSIIKVGYFTHFFFNKANRQTIEASQERGAWKIGV